MYESHTQYRTRHCERSGSAFQAFCPGRLTPGKLALRLLACVGAFALGAVLMLAISAALPAA